MRPVIALALLAGCGVTYDVEVAPHLATCAIPETTTCLYTREEGEDWHHVRAIADFDYEWGRWFDLTVRRTRVHSNAADAPSYRYHLVEELGSEPVSPGETFEMDVTGWAGVYNFDWDDMRIEGSPGKDFVCDPALCDPIGWSFEGYSLAEFAFGDPIDGPVELIAVQ